jgi:AraC-like DNA-binding protein
MPIVSYTPRLSLLVVDDEAGVREAVAAALGDRYDVHTAASSTEAVTALRGHPIAAIILDALLEEEHGLDLIPFFRRLSPARIMLLTGHGSETLAARAIWAGVDGYLNKPVSVLKLHAAIERLLSPELGLSDLAARARRSLDAYPPQPLRAAEWSRHLGAGEPHLRRLFRERYGVTPRRYLTERRLRQAGHLLWTTGWSVAEIARQVGYEDLRNFRRLFQRWAGMAPLDYRFRKCRKKEVTDLSQDKCPK